MCCVYAEERLLSFDTYVQFFVHCTSILVPDDAQRRETFGDDATVLSRLQDSWRIETDASGAMSFAQFYRSFFELLDTWTDSTECVAYVALARALQFDPAAATAAGAGAAFIPNRGYDHGTMTQIAGNRCVPFARARVHARDAAMLSLQGWNSWRCTCTR